MNRSERKLAIESALGAFATQPLYEAGLGLLDALGYQSDRTLRVSGIEEFRVTFDQRERLNESVAKVADWADVAFLRQITSEDVSTSGQGQFPFQQEFAPGELQSYVFVAVELRRDAYTRSELAQITRAINRIFDMPAMLLFKYGGLLTLAIIDRRPNRRDESRDALEKVTLVKDVTFGEPLRAHLEILNDLSREALYEDFYFHDFAGLHEAWRKRLGGLALNEKFYREVANWYFWALKTPEVILPRAIQFNEDSNERDKQRAIFFIRLLTRLIFCWFLQEKGLLPRELFLPRVADQLLKNASPEAGTYYKAFLQNLFFATLNQEQDQRGWRHTYQRSRSGNRGVSSLWRYRDLLTTPDDFEALLGKRVPFVNGGLFDCLDDVRDDRSAPNVRLDDFSEEAGNRLCLPNDLFFGEERAVDLSTVYEDTRRKKEKVSGLIEILSRYKFTVEENTPLEEEIALDPELLGKVFENLLASYNQDTRTTARKATGAFYTPREIVRYMVDEALVSYLAAQVPAVAEAALRGLFDGQAQETDLSASQKAALIKAIGRVKILDPACGSGAFPMGALHRLVDVLQKLDPNNESWKRDRLAEAERYYALLRQANAPSSELEECEKRIEDIEHSFDTRFHALDFGRKLYLIENCIYGVDIEPIACQIAKLRFFIALIVDQRVAPSAPNLGVRPLPNLETKIVVADSLVPIPRPAQLSFRAPEIDAKEAELRRVRENHFLARTPATKTKYREQDAGLRAQIAGLLKDDGWGADTAKKLSAWDPYNQNVPADFFDSEWMFGLPVGKVQVNGATPATLRGQLALVNEAGGQMEFLTPAEREIDSGFDIVIGNPPYVRIQTLNQQDPERVKHYKQEYESARKGNYDLYVVFVEAGLRLLKPDGHLAYILPHKFFNAQYGEPLRALVAKGRHLQHVVHFGDQQVFPGATNYVCLIFLAKGGSASSRLAKVGDLQHWLKSLQTMEQSYPAEAITASEWNFAVGPGASVFVRLDSIPLRLATVARIFVGLQTSADRIYILEGKGEPRAGLQHLVGSDGVAWTLERAALRPALLDYSLEPYGTPISRHWLIFPYKIDSGAVRLLQAERLADDFPETWRYLCHFRDPLRARDGGKWNNEGWFAFGRNQSLSEMERPKLVVQVLSQSPRFSFDGEGLYFTGGGNGPYYGVRWSSAHNGRSLLSLQAILNSRVSAYFIRQVSTTFRGGYWSYGKRFIEKIPIVLATPTQEVLIVGLVERLLWLNRSFRAQPEDKVVRDPLMLGYWEQALNGLVYELYFPEDLHARNLRLFDLVQQCNLPSLDSIPESNRLSRLRAEFERLYDLNHPLRSALHDLQTVEVVRIIEGKE